jgi:hypothetical protein
MVRHKSCRPADLVRLTDRYLARPGHFGVGEQREVLLAVKAQDEWYELGEQPSEDGLPHGGQAG